MGTVWGVAAVSTLVQSSIYEKLEATWGDLPGADAVSPDSTLILSASLPYTYWIRSRGTQRQIIQLS